MANKAAVIPDQFNVNDKTGIIESFKDIGNGEHARVVALDAATIASIAYRVGAAANVTDVSAVLNALGISKYNLIPPTIVDQQYNQTQIDSRGNSKVSLWTGSQAATYGAFTAATTAPGAVNAVGLGIYNASLATLTEGQLSGMQLGLKGQLIVSAAIGDITANAFADGAGNTSGAYLGVTQSRGLIFNNVSWDRSRSIINATNSIGTGIQAVGLIAQLDDTSPTAITENQFGNVRMNAVRALYTEHGPYIHTNVPAGQATTVIKASAGYLHAIVLNSAATATNTTVVYDNASGAGTVIGRPAVVAATVPVTLIFDCAFVNGLTIITAVANGGDMTVIWR